MGGEGQKMSRTGGDQKQDLSSFCPAKEAQVTLGSTLPFPILISVW